MIINGQVQKVKYTFAEITDEEMVVLRCLLDMPDRAQKALIEGNPLYKKHQLNLKEALGLAKNWRDRVIETYQKEVPQEEEGSIPAFYEIA